MVAAGHRLSARAGAEALARGGGAVDAVCAAAFAAAVAESPLTGPGAGGFLLVRSPSGETALMDFFVAAPGLGPRGRPLDPADLDHFTVPFGGAEQVFHIGPASVAVPGMVAGLGEAVRRHGRLPLAEVVAPAVALAREGVVLTRETGYLHEILGDMLTFTPRRRGRSTRRAAGCWARATACACPISPRPSCTWARSGRRACTRGRWPAPWWSTWRRPAVTSPPTTCGPTGSSTGSPCASATAA